MTLLVTADSLHQAAALCVRLHQRCWNVTGMMTVSRGGRGGIGQGPYGCTDVLRTSSSLVLKPRKRDTNSPPASLPPPSPSLLPPVNSAGLEDEQFESLAIRWRYKTTF